MQHLKPIKTYGGRMKLRHAILTWVAVLESLCFWDSLLGLEPRTAGAAESTQTLPLVYIWFMRNVR